ncbi:MAG: DMT family transporter [Pseudomonadota bacterium]
MNNLTGILLMVTAMAGFALEDMFVKQLSSTISISQILITIGICSACVFTGIAHAKGHNVLASGNWTKATVARMLAEAVAAVAFVKSLSLVPISTVAAIFQVTPLAITMGAALFLGEQVGWRRWAAILVGFIGVLIIIRPGFTGFDASVLFVLISVVGVSARDLITRTIPDNIASTVISSQAFASLFLAGILVMFMSSEALVSVSKTEAMYFAGAVIFGVTGYYGIVVAMRVGDTAVVTPFRYTRLLFSVVIGVLVFSESPDTFTILGATVVICTGLYTIFRENLLLAGKSDS